MTFVEFLRLGWLGRRRMMAYSAILLLGSLVSMVPMFMAAMGPDGSDFLAFWSAGKMAIAGQAAQAYDPDLLGRIQAEVGRSDVFAFVNPPPMLLAVWPLGFLDYPAAWMSWTIATYLLWLVATRRLFPSLGLPIAAFPGGLVAAWHAQTGFLTSAFQAGAAQWLRDKPLRAGLCIGALIVKPHLAVLFPVALLAGRQWRAIGGAALGVAGLTVLAWSVFGTDAILAYPQTWQVSNHLLATGEEVFFLRQVTIYAQIRLYMDATVAMAGQALVSGWMAVLVWRAWSRGGALEGKLALLFAATPLATPYLFAYDLPFLVIPVCWLIARRGAGASGWWRPSLVLLYLSPLLARALALPLGINLMPAFVAALVWLVWRARRGEAPQVGQVRPGPAA